MSFLNKTEVAILSEEEQKKLFEVVSLALKDKLENENCFVLPVVHQLAGKAIEQLGYEKVNWGLFASAPHYFRVGYSAKNAAAISLVGFPDDENFSLERRTTPMKQPATATENQKSIETRAIEALKNEFKTNDVSFQRAQGFLMKRRFFPSNKTTAYSTLIHKISLICGTYIRDNGEGTKKEPYLVLRMPAPIPEEVKQNVAELACRFFSDKEVCPNSDFGQVLRENGIDFKSYNFCDLTAFLRAFPELFIIVPKQTEIKGKTAIYIRPSEPLQQKAAKSKTENYTPKNNANPMTKKFDSTTGDIAKTIAIYYANKQFCSVTIDVRLGDRKKRLSLLE